MDVCCHLFTLSSNSIQLCCIFYCYAYHLDLHVLTHSFPALRPSDLPPWPSHLSKMPHYQARSGRSCCAAATTDAEMAAMGDADPTISADDGQDASGQDRKSTRLNSSH